MKKVRGYIFSRSFYSSRVPQHVQNIVIRDFCNNHNLQYLLSATEYSMKNCYLILENVISELGKLDGVVFYSLFQLPADKKIRENIFNKFNKKSKTLFFAVENFGAKNAYDFDKIEKILGIQNLLSKSLKSKDFELLKNFIDV